MRIWLIAALCLVCSAVTAEQRRPEPGASDEIARFEAALPKLELWPEQKPRIQKLLAQVKGDLKKIQAAPGTPEQKRPKFQALRERSMKQLDRIITVAQAEKLKQLLGGGNRGPSAPIRRK